MIGEPISAAAIICPAPRAKARPRQIPRLAHVLLVGHHLLTFSVSELKNLRVVLRIFFS